MFVFVHVFCDVLVHLEVKNVCGCTSKEVEPQGKEKKNEVFKHEKRKANKTSK